MGADRVANLDLLRALAIALVVVCNAGVEGVIPAGAAGRLAASGWVGVDLFFVLSGWLIGGLYWRELGRFGDVDVVRFWARRWLRTIPAYLVALHAVFLARRAFVDPALAYDAGYLAFVQNYYAHTPYWGLSWSLCVEEHFYLALPLALGLALRVRGGVPLLLAFAAAASLAARLLTVEDGAPLAGLHYGATHMRLEGLALGVGASYVYHRRPAWWPALQRAARVALVPGLAFVAAVPFLPPDVVNRYAFTGVDLAFAAVVVAVATRRPLPGAASRVVRAVAVSSYSVYMTQSVALEAYWTLAGPLALPPLAHLAAGVGAVAVVGGAFYAAVERPSLRLRHLAAPRRTDDAAPATAGVALAPAPAVARALARPSGGHAPE